MSIITASRCTILEYFDKRPYWRRGHEFLKQTIDQDSVSVIGGLDLSHAVCCQTMQRQPTHKVVGDTYEGTP